MRLNLGVGPNPDLAPDVVNVDQHLFPGVQVVWDLDEHPWPFRDCEFTDIRAVHVFEHLADPLGFMSEAHRILTRNGTLRLYVPHWRSENAYTDPTHRRFCTEHSFDYWCAGTRLFGQSNYAGPAVFDRTSVLRNGDDIEAVLTKL